MFQKILGAIQAAVLLALCACSSATAPSTGASREYHKLCLEDLRQVLITSPLDGSSFREGDFNLVTWETREVCGRFTVDVSTSVDGGRTYITEASGLPNATSGSLGFGSFGQPHITELRIRVTVHDGVGDLSDEVRIWLYQLGPPARRSNGPPQQYE